jgi:hypothetical protein
MSSATLSFTVNKRNFSDPATTPTPPDIYINSADLTTQKVNLTSFEKEAATAMFKKIDEEFMGDIATNSPTKWGKIDASKLTDDFLVDRGTYYVLITANILHGETTYNAGAIPENNSVVIKFGPYEIPELQVVPGGGGRRRTKMSKRHPKHRTRKNKIITQN